MIPSVRFLNVPSRVQLARGRILDISWAILGLYTRDHAIGYICSYYSNTSQGLLPCDAALKAIVTETPGPEEAWDVSFLS